MSSSAVKSEIISGAPLFPHLNIHLQRATQRCAAHCPDSIYIPSAHRMMHIVAARFGWIQIQKTFSPISITRGGSPPHESVRHNKILAIVHNAARARALGIFI
jgi:hypothetical protein